MTAVISDADLLRRRLPLAGTFNLRDVGGYPAGAGRATRWRALLRSDALHGLDDAGRRTLAELGIRTVVDLRQDAERRAAPDALDGVGARVVSMPLYDGELPRATAQAPSLPDVYRILVERRGHTIAAAIGELARPGALPAIVHCTAGKDRTGIVVALTLSVLGVPDDVIAADFSATELFLGDEFRQRLSRSAAVAGADPARLVSMLGADPALIRDTLARVRDGGGDVRGYLVRNGLDEADLDGLRERLMEGVTE